MRSRTLNARGALKSPERTAWRFPLFGVLVLISALAPSLRAHQLDEYLGITHVGIQPHKVQLFLSLTPGANIATRILAGIDHDGNGDLSAAEQRDYAERLMGQMTLAVDDLRPALQLAHVAFPARADLLSGQGVIQFTIEANIPRQAAGHHSLFVANNSNEVTVFVASALRPEGRDVTIRGQERDRYQRHLRIEYEVAATGTFAGRLVAGAGLALIGVAGLLTRRRWAPRRTPRAV